MQLWNPKALHPERTSDLGFRVLGHVYVFSHQSEGNEEYVVVSLLQNRPHEECKAKSPSRMAYKELNLKVYYSGSVEFQVLSWNCSLPAPSRRS